MFDVAYRCYEGEWYCSATVRKDNGIAVHRYVQKDSTWGRVAYYFSSRALVEAAFASAGEPDFSLTPVEIENRRRHNEQPEFSE